MTPTTPYEYMMPLGIAKNVLIDIAGCPSVGQKQLIENDIRALFQRICPSMPFCAKQIELIIAAVIGAEINAAARRASVYMVLGTFLSLLLALACAYWLSRYIAAPIAMLAAAARRIGGEPKPEALVAVKADPHVPLRCAAEWKITAARSRLAPKDGR